MLHTSKLLTQLCHGPTPLNLQNHSGHQNVQRQYTMHDNSKTPNQAHKNTEMLFKASARSYEPQRPSFSTLKSTRPQKTQRAFGGLQSRLALKAIYQHQLLNSQISQHHKGQLQPFKLEHRLYNNAFFLYLQTLICQTQRVTTTQSPSYETRLQLTTSSRLLRPPAYSKPLA